MINKILLPKALLKTLDSGVPFKKPWKKVFNGFETSNLNFFQIVCLINDLRTLCLLATYKSFSLFYKRSYGESFLRELL